MQRDIRLDDYLAEKGLERIVKDAQNFLKTKFESNPRYSFNNPDIMINHSIDVMNIALEVSKDYEDADLVVILLGALFHDIGKTANESPEVLQARHAQFNWDIANEFLSKMNLSPDQLVKLTNILFENPETLDTCLEQRIVKETDKVAFITDEALQVAFYTWAEGVAAGNGKVELQRKLDKTKFLQLPGAEKIAGKYREVMKEIWRLE